MPNLSAANYGIEEAGGAQTHLFTFTMIIGGICSPSRASRWLT